MPHLHYKLDLTVEVFIVHDGKVLLRKHDKLGKWLSVGGHLEPNEDPNEAALREVKEEVGLDVELVGKDETARYDEDGWRSLVAPRYMNRHRIKGEHEHATLVFFAKAATDAITQGDEEKSEECRWLTKEELEQGAIDVKDEIRFYAEKALEELS